MFKPHYVRDYRRMVGALRRAHDHDTAMSLSVGGEYAEMGAAQAALLQAEGLRDDDYVVDVGCGAGRLAFALRAMPRLRYHGTDVVPELLDYARRKVERPDWRFSMVESLHIPETDGQADMVALFSVVTHLSEREILTLLAEVKRVTRPGGTIIVSFLDTNLPAHTFHIEPWFRQWRRRLRGVSVHNVAHTPEIVRGWAAQLGLGARLCGTERVGQSYCVMTKPG